MAFGDCRSLRDFRLNEAIQELDFLCFWATPVKDLRIPSRVKKTSKQLGIGQRNPRTLYLPDGLETVENDWLMHSDAAKIVVSSSVRVLGERAFCYCKQLREVIFEPGSHLESIGDFCFSECMLREIVIPRSV